MRSTKSRALSCSHWTVGLSTSPAAAHAAARAAAAQGNQPGPLTGGGPGPQGLAPRAATVVGNTPGAGAKPISPGVG